MTSAASEEETLLPGPFPQLCVFDLDACLWDKEMFEMECVPSEGDAVRGDLNGRGEGCIGVMSGADKISLHAGALRALQDHADGKFPGMKLALASSANTPFAEKIGRTALKMLEVVPGMTVWDVLMRDWDGRDINQIGRQPPKLSPNKAQSHFPNLKEETGIRFDKMVFYDDCNWGDHCGQVAAFCTEGVPMGFTTVNVGPVTMRTPDGLSEELFFRGLTQYAARELAMEEKTQESVKSA
jgi:magnesium-dependent phosphatase 1